MHDRIPVYIRRQVMNGRALTAWARELGLSGIIDPVDLHMTVLYCRTPVHPDHITPATDSFSVQLQNAKPFEIKGHLAIPLLDSKIFADHARHLALGATHDYADGVFRPHVTVKYDVEEEDIQFFVAREGFSGVIELGPEKVSPLEKGWRPAPNGKPFS
ncbi:hypothetical protein [Marimonas lutisalis]|uniref:hypothetical protein n=1 Tax=Marimonas lutisalis TaxID=2545756 RepID=UPI0010F544C4|nr:hypothetical protein [Marimonas lutisalis]